MHIHVINTCHTVAFQHILLDRNLFKNSKVTLFSEMGMGGLKSETWKLGDMQ